MDYISTQCIYDPLSYALAVYPWGKPGTPLADWDGPDVWQATVGRDIGEHMEAIATKQIDSATTQVAVRSGHGVGKSAFLGGVIIPWFLATRKNPQVVVTAGTETQLRTKLWREVAKWKRLARNGHWFDWRATSFSIAGEGVRWAANAIPWSVHNPDAFQGTHEQEVLVIFDEASSIEDIIWESTEGAFTTSGLWVCFGNPTKAVGRFADCFGKFKHRWLTYTIDSRQAKAANQNKNREWIEDWGEDSDFVRVRVLGLPPKSSETGLFTASMIEEALARDIREHLLPYTLPKVCGIDIGAGVAKTVLCFRRGPLVRPQDIIKFSDANLMSVADRIATILARERPHVAFIDAHGIGKAVYDRLVQLNYTNVIPVYGGDRSRVVERKVYYNPRAEWYGRAARWITESKIPDDSDLRDELLAQPAYYTDLHLLKLMSKEDMREHGLPSPDTADALSMTFAQTVAPVSAGGQGGGRGSGLPEVG